MYNHEVVPDVFIGSDGKPHAYKELLSGYSQHEWGLFHAAQDPRYSQLYGYDHEQMVIDLGDDVHPVRHMLHTESAVALPILLSKAASSSITPRESHIVRLTAGVHDLGECKHKDLGESAPGDVAYNFKKAEHEQAEKAIREIMYGRFFGFIPDADLEEVEEVLAGQHEDLSPLFEYVERYGYYLTAICAGGLALSELEKGEESLRVTQLARLGVKVSNDHIEYLDKNRTVAKVVDRHLQNFDGLQDRIDTEFGEFLEEDIPA